jgi:hypothetical protein
MSGWLDKRGGLEATKRWKKRWCILSNHLLRYYKSDTDSNPAGTIFAEDIVDVAPDEYESKKDSKVSVSFEGAQSSQSTVALSFSPQHGFVFKILTRGRDYIFNAPNQQKRVNS